MIHPLTFGPTIAAVTIAVTDQGWMLFAVQALNGATVALAAPALTVVIASNYHGRQQGQAIGFLASAIAVGGFIGVPAMIYILGVPAIMASAVPSRMSLKDSPTA